MEKKKSKRQYIEHFQKINKQMGRKNKVKRQYIDPEGQAEAEGLIYYCDDE